MGNTSSPMPTVSEMQTGITGFLTNSNILNCTVDNTISNLLNVCPATGINNGIKDISFNIYPNPFTSDLYSDKTEQIEFYELVNSSGQIIWTGNKLDGNNFSSLARGLYFLKLKTIHSTQIVKLIKQ